MPHNASLTSVVTLAVSRTVSTAKPIYLSIHLSPFQSIQPSIHSAIYLCIRSLISLFARFMITATTEWCLPSSTNPLIYRYACLFVYLRDPCTQAQVTNTNNTNVLHTIQLMMMMMLIGLRSVVVVVL